MKKIQYTKTDDMLPEYDFDYNKARPNRFAGDFNKAAQGIIVAVPAVNKSGMPKNKRIMNYRSPEIRRHISQQA